MNPERPDRQPTVELDLEFVVKAEVEFKVRERVEVPAVLRRDRWGMQAWLQDNCERWMDDVNLNDSSLSDLMVGPYEVVGTAGGEQ
ncbi:hypothetical protein [Streptacidiphilus cavernicola]|uniref:Uncharacterized protein n=1 Tax=Streptacidiphilus cavernicola TaxID=3342716 RepID=A0ABV6VYN3_9ACTN